MLAVTLSKKRARPRRAVAGVERGARPAAALGPAMVAAHAADPRLRDRPARLRRYFRRLSRDRRARSTSSSAEAKEELNAHRRHGRRGRGGRYRLPEAAAGRIATPRGWKRSSAASRSWSASTNISRANLRRSPAAADAILTVSEDAERGQIERLKAWRAARDNAAVAEALEGAQTRRHRRRQYHAGLDRLRQSRRHHRRMGLDAARGLRRIPRAHRRRPRHAQ